MENILLVPIAASVILSLFIPLVEVAQDASEKVLRYSEDMNNALDCAFAGVNIGYCAPNLVKTDFSDELNKTNENYKHIERVSTEELKQLLEELKALENEEETN